MKNKVVKLLAILMVMISCALVSCTQQSYSADSRNGVLTLSVGHDAVSTGAKRTIYPSDNNEWQFTCDEYVVTINKGATKFFEESYDSLDAISELEVVLPLGSYTVEVGGYLNSVLVASDSESFTVTRNSKPHVTLELVAVGTGSIAISVEPENSAYDLEISNVTLTNLSTNAKVVLTVDELDLSASSVATGVYSLSFDYVLSIYDNEFAASYTCEVIVANGLTSEGTISLVKSSGTLSFEITSSTGSVIDTTVLNISIYAVDVVDKKDVKVVFEADETESDFYYLNNYTTIYVEVTENSDYDYSFILSDDTWSIKSSKNKATITVPEGITESELTIRLQSKQTTQYGYGEVKIILESYAKEA